MRIYGIDFTSRPSKRKPLTCLRACLEGDLLRAEALDEWRSFAELEAFLHGPGPWIAGIDFPFGQARRFVETIGWPDAWPDYVRHARNLGRTGFRAALDRYRRGRPAGDKEHRRGTDVAAGSISPQKLYGTPVGLMFFEGAPRLLEAGVTIPGVHDGDPQRIVVEAYPGLPARHVLGGRRSYKNDLRTKQNEMQRAARRQILEKIVPAGLVREYGMRVEAEPGLAEEPGGDHLDALLCAVQAGWAWTQSENAFGMPADADPREGWIADPALP